MSVHSIIETVEEADLAVAEQAAEVRHHPLTRALGQLSEVADQPPMMAVGALTLAGGLVSGQWRVAEAGGRLLASVAIAAAVRSAVKRLAVRTQPHVLADGGRHEPGWLGAVDGPHSSFPFGHTADAVAAARAVARVYPHVTLPACAAAAAVAAIQIPRCAHYPSDVTAGASVGLVAEALVDRIWSQLGEPPATNTGRRSAEAGGPASGSAGARGLMGPDGARGSEGGRRPLPYSSSVTRTRPQARCRGTPTRVADALPLQQPVHEASPCSPPRSTS